MNEKESDDKVIIKELKSNTEQIKKTAPKDGLIYSTSINPNFCPIITIERAIIPTQTGKLRKK